MLVLFPQTTPGEMWDQLFEADQAANMSEGCKRMSIRPVVHAQQFMFSVLQGDWDEPRAELYQQEWWRNMRELCQLQLHHGNRVGLSRPKRPKWLSEIRVLRIEIHSADAASDKRECIIRFENFTFYLLLLMLVMLLWRSSRKIPVFLASSVTEVLAPLWKES